MWAEMKMNPTDRDVSGYTYTYLMNGQALAEKLDRTVPSR
jgi:hypothetical protein